MTLEVNNVGKAPSPIDVADSDFEQIVLQSSGPVLVDFWAEWCGPCKLLGPTIGELAADYGDRVTVAKVDVDANPQAAMRFGVRSIPTVMLFKDGQAVETTVGVKSKAELAALIDAHL